MVVAYSPHRNGGGGGTLHFPSPTNIRHAEPNSAIAQLRHSLSRSPSKGPAFRLVTSKSASPSPRSPLSPQKLTDCLNLLPSTNRTLQSPFTTPYARNARRNRFGVRKLSPVSPSARSAQRAPVKRALSESTQNGNATPPSPSSSCARLENCSSSSVTPEAPGTPLSKKENADAGKADNLLAPQHTFHRRDNGSAYLADLAAKSSPLKRGDGIMNYDLTNLGSPSAKRRSLHGASFGADFNIFDAETVALGEDIMDVRMERSVSETPPATDHAAFSSSIMPKRTSSLRKTTLQQRYEKPSFARGKPVLDQASMTDALTQDVSKARQRLSLDHVFPQISRDSPFSSPGNLPNASVHPLLHPRKEFFQQPLQRHPLSRTMTQSSSSSSLVETDDSPTHAPAQPSDFRRSHVDFTKSVAVVPPWAAHPNPISRATTQISSNIENSFATPEKYKLAKPLPAAFMSTGLISKRNKDMIKDRNFKASTATMPDTPCKRHISMAPMNYTTTPGSIVKPRVKHQSVHSFGTPSTPFNPHANQPPLGASVKGAGIFGSSYRGNGRRESFASVDGDENFQSPSDKVNSQLSNEFDVPPTPTKQITGPGVCQASTNLNEGGSSSSLEGADSGSFGSFGTMSPQRNQHCKSNFNCFSSPTADEDGDSVMEESSSTTLRFRSLAAISSFSSRSHLLAHPRSPASLSRKPISLPFVLTRNAKTKPSPLSPASPVPDRNEHKSPHTPHTPQQVGILPPDPSGLSISVYGHGVAAPGSNPAGTKKVALPPSTPTASRDSLSQFGNSRLSMTPNQIHGPVDVDSCLISRFDKVDLIGSGEFSQVFRVSRPSTHVPPDYFSTIASPASGETEKRKLVWAVKKSRFPYIGPKDRARKLQEVEVLSALGRGDHTLHLVESWENRRHLYIQTEYCEEGSLDEFLTRMGKAARLDDFRIWKIMLELASVCVPRIWFFLQLLADRNCREFSMSTIRASFTSI